MRRPRFLFALLLGVLLTPLRASAQSSADAFMDSGARELLLRARAFRDAADSTILSYTATVHSRMAAGLRMPLKDRTLYRRESSERIRWSREAPSVIRATSFREQTPAGVSIPNMGNVGNVDEVFNPTQDRIYFGLTDRSDGDDDIWIQHPIVAGAERYYRYRSGDTLTVRMSDGRSVRAIELRVVPRESSGHLVSGSLWIDSQTGTIVQALYRLARPLNVITESADPDDRADFEHVPGMFKPLTFDISLVAMEYSLYDFRYWMPRVTRLEGNLRAGVITAPASYEISYDIDTVVTATPELTRIERAVADSVATAWTGQDAYMGVRKSNGKTIRVIMPLDSMGLMKAPDLPPPIWKQTSEFITGKELDDFYSRLDKVAPVLPEQPGQAHFTWGLGAADLLRYNRVEGLSVGAREEYAVPGLTARGTVRIGLARIPQPDVALDLLHPTHRRDYQVSAYYGLTTVDPLNNAFGFGNSTSALLLGRDDGEYYQTVGASLKVAPSQEKRAHYDITFFAQHDHDVSRNTNVSLRKIWNSDFAFRPNIDADRATLEGATFSFRPWWGSDPFRVQGGIDGLVEGAVGSYEFTRARLTARTAVPIGSKYRMALEAGGGHALGTLPVQRLWYLGGASTLRGYDGSALRGKSFARARTEFGRNYGWGGLTVFGDGAWANSRGRIDAKNFLYSAGVGSSLLDGLMRVDIAHQLNLHHDWRVEMYLDAIL